MVVREGNRRLGEATDNYDESPLDHLQQFVYGLDKKESC